MSTKSLKEITHLTAEDLRDFTVVKEYADDSHFSRKLIQHVPTGELYFYEFYEKIDWVHGNDPQYSTYIPVDSIRESDDINEKNMWDIHKITPRIVDDWKEDGTRTTGWIK